MKVSVISGILIAAALAFPASASAGITWEQCLVETRQTNPQLISAHKSVDIARANKAVTRSGALPSVTASAGAGRSSTNHVGRDSYDYGVSGQQLLFDGFKVSNDLASDNALVKAAAYRYAVVSSNIRYDLWSAFVGLLNSQETLKVSRDILKRREDNLELVSLRYDVGREHKGSLLTARANVSQARYEVEEAQRNVELYQRRLNKAMGKDEFAPLTADGELAVNPPEAASPAYEQIVQSSPFLRQVVEEKEAARFGLKSARSALFPKIYVSAGTGRSDNSWPPQDRGWSAGLSVSLPLFEGGRRQADIDRARASLEQAEADVRDGRQTVILTLAETWTDWQNTAAQALVREEYFKAAQERAMIAEGQYSAGLIGFDDWTIIEDDLVNRQKQLLQAAASAMLAEGAWLQAKGVTIDD